ncbi:MAG: nucleoside deaminase [Desulfobacterales bacterium]|nr:nucleoside deaminase [Desulfobacterales bacterium]
MRDAYFMEKALEEAKAALTAGEFPVGCVIADGARVLAAAGRSGSRGDCPNELDHAEIIALRRLQEAGYTGNRRELTLYSTMEPCLMCLGAIILNNISRIVYAYEDVMGGGTGCRLADLPPLYADAGITVIPDVMRAESLALFRAFFSEPGQSYWQDSLLAQCTLEQD